MDKKNYFISYNHKDEAWALWIDWVLRANDCETITQAYDFKAGDSFVLKMHDALQRADCVIGVLTEEYLQSDWCNVEWANAYDHFIPVKISDFKPDGLLKTKIYIDLFGLSESKAEEELLTGLRNMTRPSARPPFPAGAMTRPPFPAKSLPPNNLPNRNSHFTGRDEILDRINRRFQSGKAVSLKQTVAGLGGVGKTQAAVEYAYRYSRDYKDIWWVNAESGLYESYRAFAKSKSLLSQVETAAWPDVLLAVKNWFDEHTDYLFIFDNVEDFSTLSDCLPRDGGHVLITTRNQNSPIGIPVNIEIFTPEEATDFLLKHLGRDDSLNAGALAQRLGYLPLALEQAAAYIRATHGSCRDYLNLLEKHGLKVFDQRGAAVHGYAATINATWRISFEKIEMESARQLLNLCAYLAPDDIPLDMLIESRNELPEPLRSALGDELSFNDAIYELKQYSLVREKNGSLSLHRLLQEVVRNGLSGDKSWASSCVDMMCAVFGYNWGDKSSMDTFQTRLPHALAAAEHTEKIPLDEDGLTKAARLYNIAGYGLNYNGQYAQALQWHQKDLAISERILGKEHPDTATAYNEIAFTYDNQGEYAKALEWYRKALAIREKVLGKEHPDTAATYNNIALVYKSQGEYDKVLEWFRKALSISEKVLGKEHPFTATIYNNIALVYKSQGEYVEALEWYQKALAIREKVLGKEHPDTAATYNNIAIVYDNQEEYTKALEWYQKALTISEKVLGKEHPSTAITYNNIAMLYDSQGEYAKALEWYQKALNILEAKLGPEHPNTITVRDNMDATKDKAEALTIG